MNMIQKLLSLFSLILCLIFCQSVFAQKAKPVFAGMEERHYKRLGLSKEVALWEDGCRTANIKNTFEWWYADFLLADGTKVVVVFYTKNISILSGGYKPYIQINVDFASGRQAAYQYRPKEGDFSFSKESCNAQIGKNFFKGDLKDYHIHLEMDSIKGDFFLHNELRPWRPGTGYCFYGEKEDKYFAWLPAVPKGKVKADINVGNQHISATGSGYHDHNWGNIMINKLMNHWYWARAEAGDYTVIASNMVAEKKYGNIDMPVFLLMKGNEILAEDGMKMHIEQSEKYISPITQKPIYQHINFVYNDEKIKANVHFKMDKSVVNVPLTKAIPNPVIKKLAQLVGFDGGYHRFLGKAQIEVTQNGKTDTSENEALWELIYLGKNLDKK